MRRAKTGKYIQGFTRSEHGHDGTWWWWIGWRISMINIFCIHKVLSNFLSAKRNPRNPLIRITSVKIWLNLEWCNHSVRQHCVQQFLMQWFSDCRILVWHLCIEFAFLVMTDLFFYTLYESLLAKAAQFLWLGFSPLLHRCDMFLAKIVRRCLR